MQVPTEINAPKSFKKNSQFAFCRSKGNAFLFSVSSKSVKFHGLLLQYFLNSSKKKKERNIRDHFIIRNLLKKLLRSYQSPKRPNPKKNFRIPTEIHVPDPTKNEKDKILDSLKLTKLKKHLLISYQEKSSIS